MTLSEDEYWDEKPRGSSVPATQTSSQDDSQATFADSMTSEAVSPLRGKLTRMFVEASSQASIGSQATQSETLTTESPSTESLTTLTYVDESQSLFPTFRDQPSNISLDRSFSSLLFAWFRSLSNLFVLVFNHLFSPTTPNDQRSTSDVALSGSGPEIPASILSFLDQPSWSDLSSCIIAHCDQTQILLDQHRIAWGTQYELSRGVISGAWAWEDVRSHIHELEGSNADTAGMVKYIMRGTNPGAPRNIELWEELDREQLSIEENDGRGLGLCGDFEKIPDWYGGRIQQLGRVIKSGNSFKIVLETLESRRSHRFARFYGSRRFLQVKISTEYLRDSALNATVIEFLAQKFVLCGRVFVPLHSREEGLYLVETDEDVGRDVSSHWGGDEFRMSFKDFMNWHNPLDQRKNYDQAMSKYAARFALGLSNSEPVLEFGEYNIFFMDDIAADDWDGMSKLPAEKVMTDGCGFMNSAALEKIRQHLGLPHVPAGVQGRIGGAKGFWISKPEEDDDSPVPQIWIRASQHKIQNRTSDRAQRIFDLLEVSKSSPLPSAISAQSIANLHHNGIPKELFLGMVEDELEEQLGPFLKWDGPGAMLRLAQTIYKAGSLGPIRAQRLAGFLARARGLTGRTRGVEYVDAEPAEELDDDDTSALTGRNQYSGAPASFYETALELVQAGFNPRECQYLSDKMSVIISTTIKNMLEKCRIPVQESVMAFIVPDPLGVLKEGEIFFHFSEGRIDPRTNKLVKHLEGEVVVGRYPIRLPSDMQRVTAVNYSELEDWPDVVIASTRGERSLASLLAGGDMDGDELIVIWDPEIVQNFDNKPLTEPPERFMETNFDQDITSVERFCSKFSTGNASMGLQSALLANLSQAKVGLYSMMHENAVALHGYGSDEAIRLAYIVNTLLDSSKSGLHLKPDIFAMDRRRFGAPSQASFRGKGDPMDSDIVNLLKVAAQDKGKELQVRYQEALSDAPPCRDKTLSQVYDDVSMDAVQGYRARPEMENEFRRIREHVDAAHSLFTRASVIQSMKREQATPSPKANKSKAQRKRSRKDVMLEAARLYAQPIDNIRLFKHFIKDLKASYALQHSDHFGFTIAFQDLCNMKARASDGGNVANLRMFDEVKVYGASHMRLLDQRNVDD